MTIKEAIIRIAVFNYFHPDMFPKNSDKETRGEALETGAYALLSQQNAVEIQRLIKAKQENRLVELSIPVGSTVYMLDECNSPDDYVCHLVDCEDCKYNVWHIRPIEVDNPRLALLLAEYNDGHIFLTKEEAEKALEKKYDSHKM